MADGNNGGLIARATEQRADGRVPSLRPILFNTEMVQAILEGRKTATRRLIRRDRNDVIKMACAKGKNFGPFPENEPLPEQLMTWYMRNYAKRLCEVGDVLWVREAWDFIPCVTCGLPCASNPKEIGMTQFCIRPDQMETADGLTDGCFLYRAEGETPVFSTGHRWRPSIHMPKAAARIFLRVTEVFPERLWEIDEAGAIAEGLYKGWKQTEKTTPAGSARQAFMWLWQHLTRKGPAVQSWAANPWVWVIRFERCERPDEWIGVEEARAALPMG